MPRKSACAIISCLFMTSMRQLASASQRGKEKCSNLLPAKNEQISHEKDDAVQTKSFIDWPRSSETASLPWPGHFSKIDSAWLHCHYPISHLAVCEYVSCFAQIQVALIDLPIFSEVLHSGLVCQSPTLVTPPKGTLADVDVTKKCSTPVE